MKDKIINILDGVVSSRYEIEMSENFLSIYDSKLKTYIENILNNSKIAFSEFMFPYDLNTLKCIQYIMKKELRTVKLKKILDKKI